MTQFYLVGALTPLSAQEANDLQQSLGGVLPFDYLRFLTKYGYGMIHETLLIEPPRVINLDDEFLHGYDVSAIDPKRFDKSAVIMHTSDLDMIVTGLNPAKPFTVFPRDFPVLSHYSTFEGLVTDYAKGYALPSELVFDPSVGKVETKIEVQQGLATTPEIYKRLQDKILRRNPFDKEFVVSGISMFIIQKMGGFISFDDRVRKFINIQYQSQYQHEAEAIISSIASIVSSKPKLSRGIR